MIKTFMAGILLGIGVALATLYYVPVVDQSREASIISVTPNVGNIEAFHINVPMDRIMVGAVGQAVPVPAGLEWPEGDMFADVRAELFKIRNVRDAVVGVASRVAASDASLGDSIEWVLHLPARGSAYVTMQPEAVDGAYRDGELRAGTREFGALQGHLTERWVADSSGVEDAPAGRIELVAQFIATEGASQ